mgnify:FL=1
MSLNLNSTECLVWLRLQAIMIQAEQHRVLRSWKYAFKKRFSIVDYRYLKYSWFINAYMYENDEIKK